MENIWNKSNKKNKMAYNIDEEKIPQHIAIIMDGNGRWAKERNLPRTLGHRAGVEALRDIIKTASNLGVGYLTLYAFSTENWKRPVSEVTMLMKLLVEYLRKEIKELHQNQVKIQTIGDISKLPPEAIDEINKAKQLTDQNNGLCVNIALNYGSRDEMIRAIKQICTELTQNKITIKDIDEDLFCSYLDTTGVPDPDIVIRTSGEYRLSNFLLWQCAYTEFYFAEEYWPDFKGESLIKAIIAFQNRERRFGGV